MQKNIKQKFLIGAGILTGTFVMLDVLGKHSKKKDSEKIDDNNQYLCKQVSDAVESKVNKKNNFYLAHGKRIVDKALSFAGLVVLAPVYAAISLAIVVDDPGPVFFTQKRVGKDKHFFKLHKFRSMKMATPHDMPTHMLSNPDQYITRVGKFLRKSSLDELPQIWDIFVGNMSIIGPRPALWNQDDLIAEREKYGANSVTPGLTGWAQINGRDELEIAIKAKLDGDYVSDVFKSSSDGLKKDIKCFFGTIKSVSKADGVVEGGTGVLHKTSRNIGLRDGAEITAEDAGLKVYACYKSFNIDTSENNHKNILITGANSYIGDHFKIYAKEHYPANFDITTLDLLNPEWRDTDFSKYDCVYHVAGIAHADIGDASDEIIQKYYAVNTDLAIEVCKKCKESGVKQFIFMSSIIIYGESAAYGKEKIITEDTLPSPANFYGDSKWQADKGVRQLQSNTFKVAVVRPPMIYGKDSKGNYPILAKLAKKLPVFPAVNNQRSMLYIGNFCEFLCKLILSGEGGIYFPQNNEYTNTATMVKEISKITGHNIWNTKLLNVAVYAGSKMSGKVSRLIDKAFGNMTYDMGLSDYEGLDYAVVNLEKSIAETEGDF